MRAAARVALAATAGAAGLAGSAAPQRYALPAAVIAPVPMESSCQPEAAAQVDTGAAWLLVRAPDAARASFDRAVDLDPDCALGYWGQALARFDDADAGSAPAVAAIDAVIARAASVPARTAFEQAAMAALVRLRARDLAPGVPAAWPARTSGYRDAICGAAATQPRARLWCARALADAARLSPGAVAPAAGPAPDSLALQHVVELVREAPMDVGAAAIVLDVAADARAPIVARAIETVAAANPPAPAPHALAARAALRRGDWPVVVAAADRAQAAGVEGSSATDIADAKIDALLQIGRRADAYAEARRLLPAADAAPIDLERAARAVARVAIGDRRLDARGLADRSAFPVDARIAAEWPLIFAAGLDAALRAWPAGDKTRIAEARVAVAALDAQAPASGPSEIAWARTVIEAAIAASQDEHPDQMLHLAHAVDLERALVAAGGVRVPLVPVRELAAELWLRTYRYDDARREARAVLEAVPTRIAPHVVLARTAVRLQDAEAAADLWRRIADLRAGADPDDTLRLAARQATQR